MQVNPKSNAAARLADLVARLCRYPISDPRVAAVRYQLLTAWAGMLVDASGVAHAVLALHEFRTDTRPDDKAHVNGAELARFADVVLGVQLPPATDWPKFMIASGRARRLSTFRQVTRASM